MTTDMTAPATKHDLQILTHLVREMKDDMSTFRKDTNSRFNRLEERLYTFEIHVKNWKEELTLHFDAAVEIIRHDLRGANRDDISNIKDRVTRLERNPRLRTV